MCPHDPRFVPYFSESLSTRILNSLSRQIFCRNGSGSNLSLEQLALKSQIIHQKSFLSSFLKGDEYNCVCITAFMEGRLLCTQMLLQYSTARFNTKQCSVDSAAILPTQPQEKQHLRIRKHVDSFVKAHGNVIRPVLVSCF